jgi:hypothetical protein
MVTCLDIMISKGNSDKKGKFSSVDKKRAKKVSLLDTNDVRFKCYFQRIKVKISPN